MGFRRLQVSQVEFAGASRNTRSMWDCGEFAVGLFFLHINLGEIFGIRGCSDFLLVKKKNKGMKFKPLHFKNFEGKLWALGFI